MNTSVSHDVLRDGRVLKRLDPMTWSPFRRKNQPAKWPEQAALGIV